MIDDVLDFSKIEAGKLELEAVEFDLAELLEETTELLSPRAPRRPPLRKPIEGLRPVPERRVLPSGASTQKAVFSNRPLRNERTIF